MTIDRFEVVRRDLWPTDYLAIVNHGHALMIGRDGGCISPFRRSSRRALLSMTRLSIAPAERSLAVLTHGFEFHGKWSRRRATGEIGHGSSITTGYVAGFIGARGGGGHRWVVARRAELVDLSFLIAGFAVCVLDRW